MLAQNVALRPVDDLANAVAAAASMSRDAIFLVRRDDVVHGFENMGRWGESVSVVRSGASLSLIKWLSLNRRLAQSPDALWRACQRANPHCFRQFRVVKMRRPSFFLPAGEVVFETLTNPTQIPDAPPRGVLLRHNEAVQAHPDATFYFLRPVFTWDPHLRLYSADDLREEAEIDRADSLFSARLWGWIFRGAAALRLTAQRAAVVALQVATACVRGATLLFEPVGYWHARRSANDFQVRRLGQDLEELVNCSRSSGVASQREALQLALIELRARATIDPILCFELPDRPGELWFEAHWYEGQDDRTYVHY